MKVVSVRHTGTRFTEKILRDNGVLLGGHDHVKDGTRWRKWLAEGQPAVIPLRDPMLCLISCLNRGKPIDIVQGYNTIVSVLPANVHFFRIDCPLHGRLGELSRLARFVGLDSFRAEELVWEPINVHADTYGLKDAYFTNGRRFPKMFTDMIDHPTKQFLRDQGYDMPWLDS